MVKKKVSKKKLHSSLKQNKPSNQLKPSKKVSKKSTSLKNSHVSSPKTKSSFFSTIISEFKHSDIPTIVAVVFTGLLFITLFLIFNDIFSRTLVDATNDIYSGMVNAMNSGINYDFQSSLTSISIAFLIWFVELFVLASLCVILCYTLLQPSKKTTSHYVFLLLGISVIVGIVITLMGLVSSRFEALSAFVIMSLVYLIGIILYHAKSFSRKLILHLLKVTLIWEIIYFVLLIFHFLTSIGLLKLLKIDPYSTWFAIPLTIFLVIIHLIIIHGFLHSAAQHKHTLIRSIKHSFLKKEALLVTGAGILFLIVVQAILQGVGLLSTNILIRVIFIVLFGIGLAFYMKAILHTHPEHIVHKRI